MQIDITGHQIEVTDALRERVDKNIKRINQHADSQIQRTHVVLEVSKKQHHCDIQIYAGQNAFVAKGEAGDMYAAIDQAAQKIERQIQSAKSKNIARRAY